MTYTAGKPLTHKPLRKPLIVANWKMNGNLIQNEKLISELLFQIKKITHEYEIDVVICPPFVYLQSVYDLIRNTSIYLGAQNTYSEFEGAFTGEISPRMLSDLQCRYVIIGHSERRQLFGETNSLIARKCQAAYDAGVIPILCVGETQSERKALNTFDVLKSQLEPVLTNTNFDVVNSLILAYEPIWAIGTGVSATPQQAEEVHAFLRERIKEYQPTLSEKLKILYGGSVKADNAAALFAMPNIDGALVGGASLNANEFVSIINSFKY